jgi:hypothetical protein
VLKNIHKEEDKIDAVGPSHCLLINSGIRKQKRTLKIIDGAIKTVHEKNEIQTSILATFWL